MATDKTQTGTLTLRSSDLDEFLISEQAAVLSLTIKRMLEDDWPAGSVIPLLNVDNKTLAAVIAYLNAHAAAGDNVHKKKKFDDEFVSDMDNSFLLCVVSAANYLNVPGLIRLGCRNIADRMKDKPVEWARRVFGVKNDYTQQEEAEMKTQNHWAFQGTIQHS